MCIVWKLRYLFSEHEDDFSVFLVLDENEEDDDAADFESYVKTMREDGEWGGNLELVAAAKLYWYVKNTYVNVKSIYLNLDASDWSNGTHIRLYTISPFYLRQK